MNIAKRNRIIYWVSTIWLAIGMLSTAIVQLIKMPEEVQNMAYLGYPGYLMTILGVWKLLGVVAILIPKFPIVKEWAYAGFGFVMTGAIFSYIAIGDDFSKMAPPMFLLILVALSWYFRPADRRVNTIERINT